ncbi:MAG: hypothetical protein FJZ96_13655 [Chloroflexi bacterium]|nr:hypothetical protein [Chloroflexota bacterium]
MLNRIRELLIGPPLPTEQSAHEKLNKIRALAAFSPNALSSMLATQPASLDSHVLPARQFKDHN